MSILISVFRFLINTLGKNSRRISHVAIGQQECVLHRGRAGGERDGEGEEWGLPVAEFVSEFLIVLRFVDQAVVGRAGADVLRLLLLPDSLSEVEDRRLRRYIRFECPHE